MRLIFASVVCFFVATVDIVSALETKEKRDTDYVDEKEYVTPRTYTENVVERPKQAPVAVHRPYVQQPYQPTRYNPYAVIPGSYSKDSYGGPMVYAGRPYNPQSVYTAYLSSPSYHGYLKHCSRSYGQPPLISEEALEQAFAYAKVAVERCKALESASYRSGHYMNVSVHMSGARQQLSGYLNKDNPMYRKEVEALIMEFATQHLVKHHCISKYEVTALVPNIQLRKVRNPYGDNSCYSHSYGASSAADIRCNPHAKYRTVDGSCNNLVHKYWGKAFVCHLRLLPAVYDDGVSHPRTLSVTGGKLRSAREISNVLHFETKDRSYYTHLKMQFGQYLNHDITNTPTSQPDYGGLLQCCPKSTNHQCFPILVPPNDYQVTQYKKTCLNFVRSAPCPLCTLGPRQQINTASSFPDHSAIYGSTPQVEQRLRTHKLGLLKTGRDCYGHEIPPPTVAPYRDQCSSPKKNRLCFDSGDSRVNQHPGIQWMHTVFLRNHNSHARALYKVNPHWNDEKLYQEARRINIAEFQHIAYHEYLKIVFGPILMEYYNLDTKHHGFSYYEPYTDPTTWNDYASAACRFGHSQISGFFSLIGYRPKPGYRPPAHNPYYNISLTGFHLRNHFFDPTLMHEGWHDAITMGFLHDHAMLLDPYISDDVRNYLYRTPKEPSGGDLPASNLQRGRDHGIPPYHAYVQYCFGIKIYHWKDLELFIPKEQIIHLQKVYKSPLDIELFSGGLLEKKFPDADVGPTFACILGVQYYHLKFGDRFFFTHGYQAGSFSLAQLNEIRDKTCMAGLLCRTSDYVEKIQKHAFFPASDYNRPVSCKSFPGINYALWKEKHY